MNGSTTPVRKVNPSEYTRLTDLRIVKKWLIGGYGTELVSFEEPALGICCTDQAVMVRSVYFGRLRGAEVCEKCIDVERKFLDKLIAFDEQEEFEFDGGEAFNEVNAQNAAFERLKKEALTKDQKRRQVLEEAGQGRLF